MSRINSLDFYRPTNSIWNMLADVDGQNRNQHLGDNAAQSRGRID